jgi:UDP-2-acetamido-3-amino-2,3-dideoxy-glucuronate N-acetyltransferase
MKKTKKKNFFIHHLSDVQTSDIGENTRVWQYCVILPGASIGSNCNICSHCFIENDVIIGNRVTVKFFTELCDGIEISDDVFIGPHVSFLNDITPHSQQYLDEFPRTIIKKGASIGGKVAILPNITIGEYSMVGAGSVVTKNVPAYQLWHGNPAKHRGYMTPKGEVIGLDLISKETRKTYKYEGNILREA